METDRLQQEKARDNTQEEKDGERIHKVLGPCLQWFLRSAASLPLLWLGCSGRKPRIFQVCFHFVLRVYMECLSPAIKRISILPWKSAALVNVRRVMNVQIFRVQVQNAIRLDDVGKDLGFIPHSGSQFTAKEKVLLVLKPPGGRFYNLP